MADPRRVASLTSALLDAVAVNDTSVAWRTLSGEAVARGFPSPRAFRDWCYRAGVTVRDVAGVPLVAVAEVDRVGLDAPARPVPLSARAEPSDEIVAEVERMTTRPRRRPARGRG